MAWSTVAAPTPGTTVSTSGFGIGVANDLALLSGASATYGSITTVWTGSGGGTAAIGTGGTFTSTYRQDNKWVDVFVQVTLGTGFTAPTGNWQIVLPVTARYSGWGRLGLAVQASGPSTFPLAAYASSTTLLGLRCDATTAGNAFRVVNGTQPFTWASGDQFTFDFRYEAA